MGDFGGGSKGRSTQCARSESEGQCESAGSEQIDIHILVVVDPTDVGSMSTVDAPVSVRAFQTDPTLSVALVAVISVRGHVEWRSGQ